jgi:RNA polymerase sigma-70 factor (ECF subfamily)
MKHPDPAAGQAIGLRLARQEERALEDAYSAYAPTVLSYVSRYVGRDEAEDVMQRTFLDAWRHAGRYDPSQRFTGWLFTIAHRRAVDALRTRRHQVVDVESLRELSGEDGRETVNRFADAADVRAAVTQLPDHERVVVEMTYFDDLSQREIAERLDVPLGTVKARASRGTRRLGEIIRAAEQSYTEKAEPR